MATVNLAAMTVGTLRAADETRVRVFSKPPSSPGLSLSKLACATAEAAAAREDLTPVTWADYHERLGCGEELTHSCAHRLPPPGGSSPAPPPAACSAGCLRNGTASAAAEAGAIADWSPERVVSHLRHRVSINPTPHVVSSFMFFPILG